MRYFVNILKVINLNHGKYTLQIQQNPDISVRLFKD